VARCLHLTLTVGGAGDETDQVSLLRKGKERKSNSRNENKQIKTNKIKNK
jgi:hypothetical protein